MAYTNSDIQNKALSLISFELPTESAGILKAVCASAAAELESRLRKGVSSEEIQELFVTAAGMLALSMYVELDGVPKDGVGSFSAGNVSVQIDGGSVSTSAASLRKYAERMLAAYLDSGGFEFMGVRG
nr:MAG TPA: head-tail connector protein [Caudoviricetes sp.]